MEQRQKLFRNLFISAESKDYELNKEVGKMVSCDFLSIILEDASKDANDNKKELIFKIGKYLQTCPENSLLLNSKEMLLAQQDQSILNDIIQFMMNCIDKDQQQFIKVLQNFCRYYDLTLKNIKILTQQLSRQFHQEKFNPLTIKFILETLRVFYSSRKTQKGEPKGFFYFYGKYSGIRITNSTDIRWNFNQQTMSLLLCFELHASNRRCYLMNFFSRWPNQEICIYIENKKLWVEIYSKRTEICEVQYRKWYYFTFQYFYDGKVHIYLNQRLYRKDGFSKEFSKGNQKRDIEMNIGQDFQGKISSIYFFNTAFFPYKLYPFGFEDWESQKKSIKNKKIFQNCVFAYNAYAVVKPEFKHIVFDIFTKSHGQLLSNTDYRYNNFEKQSIEKLNGIKILLPLFYLSQFYQNVENILEKMLDLVLILFSHQFTEIEKSAIDCRFFQILSCLVNNVSAKNMTTGVIRVIKQLKNAIFQPTLKTQFFRFLWNLKINQVENPTVIQQFYEIIFSCYKNQSQFYQKAFPLQWILYYMIRNLENISNNCCSQHYLNESLLTQNPEIKNYKELDNLQTHLHLQYIQSIIVCIINDTFKLDYRKALQMIKSLLRLLLQKYSTCFYLKLLQILKHIFRMDQEKNIEAEMILKECNILTYLFHLSEKTINPDLIAKIFEILFFLHNTFKKNLNSRKMIYFVINTFRKLPNFLNRLKNNLKLKLIKSIRKKSFDDLNRPVNKEQEEQKISLKQLYLQRPQTISNSMQIYQSIKKYYSREWEKDDTVQARLDNQQAIRIISEYYKVAKSTIKQVILIQLLSLIKFNKINLTFASKSFIFNKFAIDVLESEHSLKPVSYQLALKIIVSIVNQTVQNESDFYTYYKMLKALIEYKRESEYQRSVILGFILYQILKNINIQHVTVMSLTKIYGITVVELSLYKKYKNATNMLTFFRKLSDLTYDLAKRQYGVISQSDFEVDFFYLVSEDKSPSGVLKQFFFHQLTSHHQSPQQEEQQVYLVFDNLINKSFINGDSKIESQSIVVKKIYVIEVYMRLTIILCETDIEHAQIYLRQMCKIIIVFLGLVTNQSKDKISLEKNVLGRKIFLEWCHFLYNKLEVQDHMLRNMYQQQILVFIKFIIEYIVRIDKRLGQNNNYSMLMKKIHDLKKIWFNPFLLQFFEIFMKDQQNNQFFTLIDVNNVKKYQYQYLKQLIHKPQFNYCFNRPSLSDIIQLCIEKQNFFIMWAYEIPIQELVYDLSKIIPVEDNYEESITQDILQTFDNQNPLEQKTRISYISQQENQLRKSLNSWRKLWKIMRIYNMPYGRWMNQNEITNWDSLKHRNKNFKMKVSKYCTSNGVRPLLLTKTIEPWHILRRKFQRKNQNFLNLNLIPKHQSSKHPITWLTNIKSLILGKQKSKQGLKQFKVVWVKDNIKIKGFLNFCIDYLMFRYDGVTQDDSHISFSQFKLEIHHNLYKKWYFVDIVNIIRRRYMCCYSCIQIYFSNGVSIILNFDIKEFNWFIEEINKIRKNGCFKNKEAILMNRIKFYLEEFPIDNSLNYLFYLNGQWRNRTISNFTYLLEINMLSSRSIHDYSQYPVFPWIVEMADTKSPNNRDLSKTMGGLGAQERIQVLKQKYNSNDPFNPVPPFYYGTHYSSPGVVFNYMIRLAPFTECCKQLQGGKFDLPDRMFFSLITSWRSATREMSDVRELIPEFYYLPEMFLNVQSYNLGRMQNGDIVNNVEMPTWAANPYHFVIQLRQILQSEQISKNIHNWIDLIFGYKQKGKQAESNLNVFYYLTYENSIVLDQIQDQVHRSSCQAQIVHFGQTPSQIFDKPHNKRELLQNQGFELGVLKILKFQLKQKFDKITDMWLGETQLALLHKTRISIYTITKQNILCNRITTQSNFYYSLDRSLLLLNAEDAIYRLFCNAKYFIITGYVDLSFRVYRSASCQLIFKGEVDSKITAIHVSRAGDLILLGSEEGCLSIYQIKYEINNIAIFLIHKEYLEFKISHISDNANLFSICTGRYMMIYKIVRTLNYMVQQKSKRPFIKFLRSFKNKLSVNSSLIVQSPLFGLIFTDNLGIKSYSINGQYMANTSSSPKQLILLKDKYLHDIVGYVQEQKIITLSTPDLRKISMEDVGSKNQQCFGLNLINHQRIITFGVKK